MVKKKLLLGILTSILIADSFACTTIIVGKKASSDGSIIFGRNVDAGKAEWAVHMLWHKRASNYLYKSTDNDFTYLMPKTTYSYTGIPDWNTKDRGFEEVGFNELGAAFSGTETIYSNSKLLAVDPYVEKTGITEAALATVILPQMKNARDGVNLLGKIIQTQGSGEGFGVVFADKDEVWYLENAGGHEWVAMRVPDDSYFVSANQGRIQKINLSDANNFRSSPDLIGFATKHDLYNAADGEFNFSSAFTKNDSNDITYNHLRVWTLQHKYSPAVKTNFSDSQYPVFLKPEHLLSIADVESGLQNYYQGSENDPYNNQNPKSKYRPIAVLRSQQSHVLTLRPNLPLAIANVEYVALGMSALSGYIPFYQGVNIIPLEYDSATDVADNTSAFWKYKKLQMLTLQNFPRYAPLVQNAFTEFSLQTQLKQKDVESKYIKLYKHNPQQAQKLLNDFTAHTVADAFDLVDDLTTQIIADQGKETDALYKFHGA